MRSLIAGLLIGLSLSSSAADGTGSLQITFTNIKSGKGELVVTLYRNGEHWLDGVQAYRRQLVKIGRNTATVTFAGLAFADYGLYAFHDENSNRKFDMRWLPWPRPAEGAAVSNNAFRNGPPRYEAAKFRFDRDGMQLNLALKYY
jgi:uncharacterized protein (DUF2141 family)